MRVARRFAIKAINRALEGIEGETALHTCFGYAHIVHSRPNGYPFLEELADANSGAADADVYFSSKGHDAPALYALLVARATDVPVRFALS